MNDMEWKVLMLCPNCLCKRELVVDRETVRELLKNARVGRESIMKELDNMQKKNMEEEADKFITALQQGPHPAHRLLGEGPCRRQ